MNKAIEEGCEKSIYMTRNNVLLDTKIISALLKGEVSVAEEIDKCTKVCISITVVGELFYGAQHIQFWSGRISKIFPN